MNYLILIFTFFLILLIILWIMPNKKSILVVKLLISLIQVLPISKIYETILEWNKKKK